MPTWSAILSRMGMTNTRNDPESINYLNYDCSRLFVEGSDRPFFADRLFANRLIRHVESLLVGDQQNKIYIFDGPHGSGKIDLPQQPAA